MDRWLIATVATVLLILAVVADDRHVGLIADGRQMIRTAVAIAETGEIGQALGRDFAYPREAGDAVSRFGMATSLLQVPAALAAGPVEESFGPGSSQALFLILPWLAVGVAAGAAGAVARRVGGTSLQAVTAVLLASLASPLASYAFLEFSEPLQAAVMTAGLAMALSAGSGVRARPWLEAASGFAAALAVLTKSSLIVAAPWILLPLVDPSDTARTRRALLFALLGATGPLATWLAFDLVRFGELFGGYPDDRFTHPWLDGAWRLLFGLNRGIVLFWPAVLLFVWTGHRYGRAILASAAGRAWIAAAGVWGAQFAVAAGYWGWHGMEGWGPRLFLSAIPLMAPFAAVATSRPAALVAVTVVCGAINLPPLLQHPTPVATYVMNLRWPVVSPEQAGRYPFYATSRSENGNVTVVPFEILEKMPTANPWQLYTWLWRASRLTNAQLAQRLQEPPWSSDRPDLVPAARWPADVARQVIPVPRAGFLGRSLTDTGGPYATVYLDALLDQVVRAHQQDRIDRAVRLSERRARMRPDGEAIAWRLESLRRARRASEAETLLRSVPVETRSHPLINVVLALFDRDFGQERRARALLASVASAFPDSPLQRALGSPFDSWPTTLDEMTRIPRRDALVARPD